MNTTVPDTKHPIQPLRRSDWAPAETRSAENGGEPTSDLLATLAHELRTPVAALHITLELLADFPTLNPDHAAELVRRLERNVRWLEGLVENLGTWAALQSGHLPLHYGPVQVGEMVEQVLAVVQPLLDRKGQRVSVACPAAEPVVQGDPQRLGQVLVNLLHNASTYGPPGDRIDVTVSVAAAGVEVRVTDHGPGIPATEQQRIFGPYVRGTAATHATTGYGLGLYIAKALVALHGGEVGVDSMPGEGASFWIKLPCLSET